MSAPLLGEHTEEVLREYEFTDEHIRALRDDGAILGAVELAAGPNTRGYAGIKRFPSAVPSSKVNASFAIAALLRECTLELRKPAFG